MSKYQIKLYAVIFILTSFFWVLYLLFEKSNWKLRLDSKNEKYGFPLNEMRRKMGIPIIEENWYTKDLSYKKMGIFKSTYKNKTTKLCQKWSDFKDDSEPHHKEKIVCRESEDELGTEIDRFENKINDTLTYILETEYFFGLEESDMSPWSYRLKYINPQDKDYPFREDKLTKLQVDSVLTTWGLKKIE